MISHFMDSFLHRVVFSQKWIRDYGMREDNRMESTSKDTVCRCDMCPKKLLVPMTCRCGKKFCVKHRTPEVHSCIYDFHQESEKPKLEKVVRPKLVDTID